MALADMMANFPDELTCDMAETYRIFDIKRIPARLLATLAVGLRDDSRVKRAKSETKHDDYKILLAHIADLLAWLKWSRTESGIKGENPPPSIVRHYLGLEQEGDKKQEECVVFDSPEDFDAAWKELTRS